jgi:hypothetical protein
VANLINFRWKNGEKKTYKSQFFFFFWKKNSPSCENWPPPPPKKPTGAHAEEKNPELLHTLSRQGKRLREQESCAKLRRIWSWRKIHGLLDVDAVALLKSYVSYL